MVQNFDLHIHSCVSDGEYTAEELVCRLKENGIKLFSVTDHDTLHTAAEMEKIDLGDMRYIPGIEISSMLDGEYKIHILGYFIDENNEELKSLVKKIRSLRNERIFEICEQLNFKFGFSLSDADAAFMTGSAGAPGKTSAARLLVKKRLAASPAEAYTKYLDSINTSVQPRMPASQVIEAIRAAGGAAVWAHPGKEEKKYSFSFSQTALRLMQLGLSGIEVYNSVHSSADAQRFCAFAREHGLMISGGSDFHGENTKPDVKLGVVLSEDENKKIDIRELTIAGFRAD